MFLLADAGYFADYFLLVPYARMDNYTHAEQNFNYLHSRARVDIEDTFGIFKMRWQRMHSFQIAEDIDFVPRLVQAACVLHNICRQRGDPAGVQAGVERPVVEQYEPEVTAWAPRPANDYANREAAVHELAVEYAPPEQLLGVDDRVGLRREHDDRRERIMHVLPDVYVNRARINRPEYFDAAIQAAI